MQLQMFDTMIEPIISYSSDVLGIENVDIVNKFQLKFLKYTLNLKQSTTNCMIHSNLGIIPLSTCIKSRIINFWCQVVNSKEDKICIILCRTSLLLYGKMHISCSWISYVHDNLNKLGLSNFWLDQKTITLCSFKYEV